MSEIRLISDITVEEVMQCGDDRMLAHAAWVSDVGRIRTQPDVDPKGVPVTMERVTGILKFLMEKRHGSPFEHGFLSVFVRAPIKVFREWHRHRVGWSYNEESARYKDMEPVFYIPSRDRPAVRGAGFKSSAPDFRPMTDAEYQDMVANLKAGYEQAYEQYQFMLAKGIDRGLARDVLGVGLYSSCWCSANPRSIMHFLELRTKAADAKRPSKPLYEIDAAARQLERIFSRHWPVTHHLWNANGRVVP